MLIDLIAHQIHYSQLSVSSQLMNFLPISARVTEETVYLADSTVHLFLQTDLSTDRITECVLGQTEKSPCDIILEQKQDRQYVSAPRVLPCETETYSSLLHAQGQTKLGQYFVS